MDLIIVESPTKARTLKRFLGKEFSLVATMGHVKDLPKSSLGIDIGRNFVPEYVTLKRQEEQIGKIKREAKRAKKVLLATDPDREGEAIAQHICDVLHSNSKFSRIVFHEITKRAVEKAMAEPRDIDKNLVDAQIARRVLDRLVGYKLSPLLWRKVRRGLSAGRVQSVTVRLIVDREREIEAFKPKEYWEIFCQLRAGKTPKSRAREFLAQLVKIGDKKTEVKNKKTADRIVKDLRKGKYEVSDVKKQEIRKNPYPPFKTSTMTQSAARLFSWPARKTMSVAQRLYEQGFITYHRTDSTNIAKIAIAKVRVFIKREFGLDYLPEKPRIYKTSARVAQEAHEAIRPTRLKSPAKWEKLQKDSKRLYELIWKRFVACQMAASLYDKTQIEIRAGNYLLRASGQVIKFDGWKKIYGTKELTKIQLPKVSVGDILQLIKVMAEQNFTKPLARYNEASLIKTLENLGIGRPSTYAPIISTIQLRQYVEKREGRFYPTPVGVAVNDFLIANFPQVFEYQFTADMEDSLDKIANGETKWTGIIRVFWQPFSKKLKQVLKAKRVKIETEKTGRKCPKCKKEGLPASKQGELVIRIGRFGKFISCSRFPECDYTEKYVEKIGMKCPGCKKGEVIVKKTRKGRRFYGCSRYPECKWASWRSPKEKKDGSAVRESKRA